MRRRNPFSVEAKFKAKLKYIEENQKKLSKNDLEVSIKHLNEIIKLIVNK